MSYRTFKRVLGETSLERKCRFLFGAALLVLILGSFIWFASANENLVFRTTRSICQLLVEPVLMKLHVIKLSGDEEYSGDAGLGQIFEKMATDIQDVQYDAKFLSLEPVVNKGLDTDPDKRWVAEQTSQNWEIEVLETLKTKYEQGLAELRTSNSPAADVQGEAGVEIENQATYAMFESATPPYVDKISRDKKYYYYYQPVTWKQSCIACHFAINQIKYKYEPKYDPASIAAQIDQLPFRVIRVSIPYEPTYRTINRNRAAFLALAIFTVFLSMIALYVVVRYVIVKPLQHLQDVSEQVEKGNYDAREKLKRTTNLKNWRTPTTECCGIWSTDRLS